MVPASVSALAYPPYCGADNITGIPALDTSFESLSPVLKQVQIMIRHGDRLPCFPAECWAGDALVFDCDHAAVLSQSVDLVDDTLPVPRAFRKVRARQRPPVGACFPRVPRAYMNGGAAHGTAAGVHCWPRGLAGELRDGHPDGARHGSGNTRMRAGAGPPPPQHTHTHAHTQHRTAATSALLMWTAASRPFWRPSILPPTRRCSTFAVTTWSGLSNQGRHVLAAPPPLLRTLTARRRRCSMDCTRPPRGRPRTLCRRWSG